MQNTRFQTTTKQYTEIDIPVPSTLPEYSSFSAQESPDLFLWCVDDITLKLLKQDAVIPENFREKLYRILLSHTLNIAFEEMENSYPNELKNVTNNEFFDDVMSSLTSYVENSPEIAFILNKSLIASYVTKCMEYAIKADSFVTSLLYK
jgi:hypothetical protein